MDLKVVETGDGGDIVKIDKDLVVIDGFENHVFLGLYGGNVEQSTPDVRDASDQAFDYWANNLFMPGDKSLQFNSQTERILMTTPLTSSGRVIIQQAVENDLAFMKEFAELSIVVQIVRIDTVLIAVKIDQPDNLQSSAFVFIWDATRRELFQDEINATVKKPITVKYFDFSFDFSFE